MDRVRCVLQKTLSYAIFYILCKHFNGFFFTVNLFNVLEKLIESRIQIRLKSFFVATLDLNNNRKG